MKIVCFTILLSLILVVHGLVMEAKGYKKGYDEGYRDGTFDAENS